MFDSPLAYCSSRRAWVALDQAQAQCAAEHACEPGVPCRNANHFVAEQQGESPMSSSVQLSLLNISPSDALEARIREKVAKLESLYPDLSRFGVTVERLDRRQQHGNEYAVRLDIRLPGHQVVVSRATDEDAYVALREAFDSARRQLADLKRKPQALERGV